jgi:hypothetical protein
MRRAIFIVAAVLASSASVAVGPSPFFPGQNDSDTKNRYAATERGVAARLVQVNEPPLCCRPSDTSREYRFTWLRTFDHPVVVRISERLDKEWIVVVKVASGKSGYDFDNLRLLRNVKRVVGIAEVKDLLASFDADSLFWRMPVHVADAGHDGATWLVEAKGPNGYHYVSRWSPENGVIREIGTKFLTLSGLKEKSVY